MTTITRVSVVDIEKRKHPDVHYEYIVRVHWSDETVNVICRRYSQFFLLQSKLLEKFPKEAGAAKATNRIIPFLPGKIYFGRSQTVKVALNRKEKINKYCKALINLPTEISQCQEILDFFQPTEDDIKPSSDNIANDVDPQQDAISQPGAEVSISEPIVLEQYVPIADYKKDGRNEISLRAGSVIEVVDKNETGWWFVNTSIGQGWVPSSYLEKLDGEDNRTVPTSHFKGNKYICTQNYDAQDTDEISLRKGGYVDVLEKNLDGWWRVRSNDNEGLVPATYLLAINTIKAKRLLTKSYNDDLDTVSSDKCKNELDTNSNQNDLTNVQANLKMAVHLIPIKKDDNTTYSETESKNSAVTPQLKSKLFDTQTEDQLENLHKRKGFFLPKSMSENSCDSNDLETSPNLKEKGTDRSTSEEYDISSDPIYVDPAAAKLYMDDSKANMILSIGSEESFEFISPDEYCPVNSKIPPRRKTLKRTLTSADQIVNQLENAKLDVYFAAEDYESTNLDGMDSIDLRKGDTLTVLEKGDMGWWFVAGKEGEGWVPAAFLRKKTAYTPSFCV